MVWRPEQLLPFAFGSRLQNGVLSALDGAHVGHGSLYNCIQALGVGELMKIL
jgi:hypothetical protein